MNYKLNILKVLRNGWHSFRRHYFTNVLIVFLVSIIIGGYALNTGVGTLGKSEKDGILQRTEKVYDRATGQSNSNVISDFITEHELIKIEADPNTTAAKYSQGVLSVFVNNMTETGSFGLGVLNSVNSLIFHGKIGSSILILIFVLVVLFLNIFVKNILEVGKCRYFLEHRRFIETNPDRLLFVYKHGKTLNVAKVMFLRNFFLDLWSLTVFGGIRYYYVYRFIPYILAENPEIGWREAKKIAKQMSHLNKRRVFVTDLVFIFLNIISLFTFNLLSIFVLDPWQECVMADIYMELRAKRTNDIDDIRLLNDSVLDIADELYESYPESAYQIPVLEKRKWIKIDYDRKYTLSTIVLFFFSFSFVGWVWEVFYTVVDSGILANRGTLMGPWLPIYGFGGLVIIVCLRPLRDHPFILFLGTFVACGVLEYFTAWGLETLFKVKWWDYTGFFLNLHGRICLEGLLVFGLAGVAFTYIFAPLLDNLYQKIKPSVKKPVCIVLLVIFAIDVAFSAFHPNTGAGITAGKVGEENTEEAA